MNSIKWAYASLSYGIGRALIAACVIGLMACSSPTEKANKFYEKGAALMQQGELDKARIEFQNALQIKDDMTSAWYGLAQVAERKGEWDKLFGYLNKVLDRDPKHLDANLKLGRLLLAAGKLDKALVASNTTMALAKDHADVLALRAAVLYKLDDKKGAVEQANAALAKDQNNIDALVVLATERLAAKDGEKAIEFLDRGLKVNEKNIALQLIKVQAFESLAKLDDAEQVFRKLIALYPETRALRHILAQFYLSHGRKDAAEAEYRAVAAENPADAEARLDVVRFVYALKGPKAAIQELEGVIAKDPANYELKLALAGLYQSQNDRKATETIYRSIIEKAGDSRDGIKAKGLLAAELLTSGDKKTAQTLIGEILAKDQRNEQGLLLKATLAIDGRQFDQAIADLRSILRDVPNSARALLMLAKAHEMAGSPELAQEHYMKAFQASKQATAFGMAYGEFLLKRGQAARAADVAEEMLKTTPGYVPAMKLLAQARINQGNWVGAQAVADDLQKLDKQGQTADQIRGVVFAAKKNYSESIAAFKRAYDAAPTEIQPMVALVRSYLMAGKTSEALSFLKSVVQASPDNTGARLLQGQLYATNGDKVAAEQAFQAVISQQPKSPVGYVGMANLHLRAGSNAEAEKVVAQGLAAVPGDFSLRMTQAGIYELSSRFEEAIKLYDELLKERPNSDVLANNLASLLTDHRTDKASLTRAHELALRFKRSDVPQFKDTLGWASYKQGKADEAVQLIEDASKKLPDLPVFRYHLGMSYLAIKNKDAARKELEKSLSLGDGKNFIEAEQAKQALKGLR
ncbi:MAG: tetratricopeptide repeat protein [Georgfuchsia sp.]